MAMPYNHIENTYEMSEEMFWWLKEVELFMRNYYKWKDYFSLIRETNWWKSIKHLHYHFLPWIATPWWIEDMLREQLL